MVIAIFSVLNLLLEGDWRLPPEKSNLKATGRPGACVQPGSGLGSAPCCPAPAHQNIRLA